MEVDGWYGPGTRAAHLEELESRGMGIENVPSIPLPVAPTVYQDETFEVSKSTYVYAQCLSSPAWNSATENVMDLLIDVYEPIGAPANRPLLVFYHGGGFKNGSRNGCAGLCDYFASRGFVTASVDYRLVRHYGTVPDDWAALVYQEAEPSQIDQGLAMYPASRDAKAALRWLAAQRNEFQINLDYVTTSGGSAGAHLAITVGISGPRDFIDELNESIDPTLSTTNTSVNVEVSTVLDFWGSDTSLDILEALDGVNRFDPNDPNILIFHGTNDSVVPFSSAEELVSHYQATGVEYAFYPRQGVGHGGWDIPVEGRDLDEISFEFVVETQGLSVL